MSSIESVGSTLLQYLQQMSVSKSDTDETTNKLSAPQEGDVPEPLWEDIEESAETAGLSSDEIDELRTELKSAISEAMESLDSSSTGEDGKAAIDEAVLSTLEENGVDTTAIREKMEEASSRPPGPPPDGAGQGYGAQSGQSSSIGDLLSSLTSSSSSSDDTTSQLLSLLSPLVDEQA